MRLPRQGKCLLCAASKTRFAAIGLSRDYLLVHNRSMAGVDQRIAYRRELHAGDVSSVHSSVIEIRNSSLRFVHLMRDAVADHLIAATVLTAVHMDATTRKSCAFADEIRIDVAPISSAAGHTPIATYAKLGTAPRQPRTWLQLATHSSAGLSYESKSSGARVHHQSCIYVQPIHEPRAVCRYKEKR